jgi:hypothetical protein
VKNGRLEEWIKLNMRCCFEVKGEEELMEG